MHYIDFLLILIKLLLVQKCITRNWDHIDLVETHHSKLISCRSHATLSFTDVKLTLKFFFFFFPIEVNVFKSVKYLEILPILDR